jgi:hypothetical protein
VDYSFIYVCHSPQKEPSHGKGENIITVHTAPQRETHVSRTYFYSLLSRVPGKWAPLQVLQQDPYGESSFISRDNGLFVHSFTYIHESPQWGALHQKMGKIFVYHPRSPNVDGRPTYNEVRPGSPRGLFMTLLSIPQCHAAFRMIPSTLAWVDQSPISQLVL